jgi:hypothetical protein
MLKTLVAVILIRNRTSRSSPRIALGFLTLHMQIVAHANIYIAKAYEPLFVRNSLPLSHLLAPF